MKTIPNPRRKERKEEIEQIPKNDNPALAAKSTARVLNSVIEDLEDSINNNSIESGKLSKIMVWLTCVIAAGTFLLAVFGGADLYFKIKHAHETTNISTKLGK
jgi:hypothetical protein